METITTYAGRADKWYAGVSGAPLMWHQDPLPTPSHLPPPVGCLRESSKTTTSPVLPGSANPANLGGSCRQTWCEAASSSYLSLHRRPPQQQLRTTTVTVSGGRLGSARQFCSVSSTQLHSVSGWAELEGLRRPHSLPGAPMLPCVNSPRG